MDIMLFAARLDRPFTEDERARLLRAVPTDRAARLNALHERARVDEPLCAYAVLRLALRRLYGWDALPVIAPDKRGKPCFPHISQVCFNLSHTEGAVLVGVHDCPLGVDIERIRPVSARLLQKFAAADEHRFFADWVRRESRIKCSGEGLSGIDRPPRPDERVHMLSVFSDCAACVCTYTDAPLTPTILTQDELLC